MNYFDLVLPWIACGLALAALLAVRRWIQRHLLGVGFLVAQEQHLATVIYCVVVLPGLLVHEFSRWIMAGVLNVKSTRVMKWPKADERGRIEPEFVRVDDKHNPLFMALIGGVPFLVSLALVMTISNSVLHLPAFVGALATNDLNAIGQAIQKLVGQPDFLLWLYVLFAISNTMWPTGEDRRGWEIIIGFVVGGLILLAAIGFLNAEVRWFTGPIPQALNVLTTVALTVLTIDSLVAVLIFLLERTTERMTHRYAPYRAAALAVAKPKTDQEAAPHLTSILQYRLPLPAPPAKAAARPAIGAPTTSPAAKPLPAPPGKPGLPSEASKPTGTPATTPAIASGSAPRPSTPGLPASTPAPRPGEPLRPAASAPMTPGTARPALPASTPSAPAAASPGNAPRPMPVPLSGAGRPVPATSTPASPFGARPGHTSGDYIDAEVIEDDEDESGNKRGTTSPAPGKP
ncbi:MAG: hypothetical protein ACYDBJ_11270 [Aggregatilineales bacterium]